jgi:hypothetical protein
MFILFNFLYIIFINFINSKLIYTLSLIRTYVKNVKNKFEIEKTRISKIKLEICFVHIYCLLNDIF